jgi:hypothetical protein
MSNNNINKTVVTPNFQMSQSNRTGQYVYSKESELNFLKQNDHNKHHSAHNYNN